MQRVVTLVPSRSPLFELGTPSRLFSAARGPDGSPLYEVLVVAADGSGRVETAEGLLLTTEVGGYDAVATADLVVIPTSDALLGEAGAKLAEQLRPLLTHKSAPRPGLRVASICSGAFLLGELGLLDGRPATTHWRTSAELARRFPRAEVRAHQLYVDTGDVLTSAGVAAGIDLCAHIIRRDHGTRIANDVCRSCIVPPVREAGQAQYIDAPAGSSDQSDGRTAQIRASLLNDLGSNHTTASMAARIHMSARTLERRFVAETGQTPGRWLIQARVQRAKELLEGTRMPVDRIADTVGLGTATNLRVHFQRCTGITPHTYRQQFG